MNSNQLSKPWTWDVQWIVLLHKVVSWEQMWFQKFFLVHLKVSTCYKFLDFKATPCRTLSKVIFNNCVFLYWCEWLQGLLWKVHKCRFSYLTQFHTLWTRFYSHTEAPWQLRAAISQIIPWSCSPLLHPIRVLWSHAHFIWAIQMPHQRPNCSVVFLTNLRPDITMTRITWTSTIAASMANCAMFAL